MSKPDESLFEFTYDDMGVRIGASLTRRELFAALALQGMMSIHPSQMAYGPMPGQTIGEWIAGNCVDAADALIAELAKADSNG